MVTIAVKQKVSRAHVAPQAVCKNLINALELFYEISRREATVWLKCWLWASKNEAA